MVSDRDVGSNADRSPIWPFWVCPLLAGAILALAWWDWTYQGQIVLWWQEKPIYTLFQQRLIWTLFLFESVSLLLWWVSIRTNINSEQHMLRASAPFLLSLLATPFFLRYSIHPLGIQPGSSAWAYGLGAITSALIAIPLGSVLHTSLCRINRPRLASILVGVLVLLYVLVFGFLSLADHISFRTHALDTGTMDQAAWNTINGRILERTPLYRSPAEGSRYENRLLDAKLELIFVPLSALYWLWADPRILLVVQTLCLAAGAIPLYGLVRDQTRNALWGALIAAAYLLYLPLHYVNMAEFHPSALMVSCLIAAWRSMRAARWRSYYLWIGLALACRIEAAFVLLALGLVMLAWRGERSSWQHGQWPHGLATILIALAWLALDFGLVLPLVRSAYGPGAGNLIERRFGALGSTPLDMARNVLANPGLLLAQLADREKLQTLFDLFAPLGFTSLFHLPALLPALPILAINLLAGSEWQSTIHAHYMAPVIPFVWIAAGEVLAWLAHQQNRRWLYRAGTNLVLTIVINTLLVGILFSPYPPGKSFHIENYYQKSTYDDDVRAILVLVPPDASVCAQSDLHPHLSQRRDAALFYRCALSDDELAEYVALDLDAAANKSPLDFHTFYELVDLWLDGEEYGVIAQRGGALLLRRGAPRANIDEVREALARYGETMYRVDYLSANTPAQMQVKQLYQVSIHLRNSGSQCWEAGPWLPVRMSYRWWTEEGALLVSESMRTNVPHRVEPGNDAAFEAWIIAPPRPGHYMLEWDLLREGDAWFSERGGQTLKQMVIVE
ncbi:MAG: DUF2079 domain-containing protein [Anaerolineae bacterium]|nr:DUF2079 domain-containing protein [Anaerolineae bacterium]